MCVKFVCVEFICMDLFVSSFYRSICLGQSIKVNLCGSIISPFYELNLCAFWTKLICCESNLFICLHYELFVCCCEYIYV
jgi:hypothetical protein